MCKLSNYFIITTTFGIYMISHIESGVSGLSYELITSQTAPDNGLSTDNNFTYAFPIPSSNRFEVNGNGGTSCVFNCDTKMGTAGTKTGGTHSRHFNNEPMLFTTSEAYDDKGNKYPVSGGLNYVMYNDFMFFSSTSSIMVFLKESPGKSITLTFADSIKTLYMDGFSIYLISADGKVYCSGSQEGEEGGQIYFIFFNYEEFKEREERGEDTTKIDIRTTAMSIFTYLNELKGEEGSELDSAMAGVDFVFYITGGEDKRIWTMIGDDGRRDETFKKMAEAFDVG
jgi:hypothetical protein